MSDSPNNCDKFSQLVLGFTAVFLQAKKKRLQNGSLEIFPGSEEESSLTFPWLWQEKRDFPWQEFPDFSLAFGTIVLFPDFSRFRGNPV